MSPGEVIDKSTKLNASSAEDDCDSAVAIIRRLV